MDILDIDSLLEGDPRPQGGAVQRDFAPVMTDVRNVEPSIEWLVNLSLAPGRMQLNPLLA